MHCIILETESNSFPHALRPVKGRAAIDYLLDDILLQKDITAISIIANNSSKGLLTKHLKNVYPQVAITIHDSIAPSKVVDSDDDILFIQAVVHTSLKLQDFIRYYKQFKTVTKAAYNKQAPQEIPFTIIPKKYCRQIDTISAELEFHTYNCGSGFCHL